VCICKQPLLARGKKGRTVMQISVFVEQAEAIRSGKLAHGRSEVEIQAWADWTERERLLLAGAVAGGYNCSEDVDKLIELGLIELPEVLKGRHFSSTREVARHDGAIVVNDPTPDGLHQAIAAVVAKTDQWLADAAVQAATEREGREKALQEHREELLAAYKERGVRALLEGKEGTFRCPDDECHLGERGGRWCTYSSPELKVRPDCPEELRAEADAALLVLNREAREKMESRIAAHAAEHTAAKAEEECCDAIFDAHATAEQKARLDAEYLSEKEFNRVVRDVIFGLIERPRFVRLELADVACNCLERFGDPTENDMFISVGDAETLDAESFAELTAVKKDAQHILEAFPALRTVDVTPRIHKISCTDRGCSIYRLRLGILVVAGKTTRHSREFSVSVEDQTIE